MGTTQSSARSRSTQNSDSDLSPTRSRRSLSTSSIHSTTSSDNNEKQPQPIDFTPTNNTRPSSTRSNELDYTAMEVVRQPLSRRSFTNGSSFKRSTSPFASSISPPAQGKVLYATLEWLVVAMTDSSHTDHRIKDMVLLLHPSFCTSLEFANALVSRFKLCSKDAEINETDSTSPQRQILQMFGTADIDLILAEKPAVLHQSPSSSIPLTSTETTTTTTETTIPQLSQLSIPTSITTTPPTKSHIKSVSVDLLSISPTATSPTTPPTVPGDTPANQRLRVRLKVLSVFSKWIKSDLFQRDVKREETTGNAEALLTYVRDFLVWTTTCGSDGQKKHGEGLLKHVNSVKRRSNLSNLSNQSNPSNDNDGKREHREQGEQQEEEDTVAVVAGLQPSEEAMQNPSGYLYRHTSHEVAMSLTFIGYDEISNVHPRDLSGKKFGIGTLATKTINSPTVMYVIQRFNTRVRWVCSVLLWKQIGTPGDRAATISFWIDVATECLSLHNFHTALIIMTALQSPCINVVTNNMSVVSERSKGKFEDMKMLMSHENNYERYRRICSECDGRPHVPAFPVITQDLMRLEDGTKSYHEENLRLINVTKFQKIFSKIDTFCSVRKNPYSIKNVVSEKNRGRSNTSNPKDGNVLVIEAGMQHLLSHWLFPPPTEMELFHTARLVLDEESKNLVKTLDYLGL